jgi:hypothetical protein
VRRPPRAPQRGTHLGSGSRASGEVARPARRTAVRPDGARPPRAARRAGGNAELLEPYALAVQQPERRSGRRSTTAQRACRAWPGGSASSDGSKCDRADRPTAARAAGRRVRASSRCVGANIRSFGALTGARPARARRPRRRASAARRLSARARDPSWWRAGPVPTAQPFAARR